MANWKLRIDQANTEIKQADQKRLQAIAGPSKIPYSNLQNIPGIIANVPSYQQFALSMKQYLNEVLREVASFKKLDRYNILALDHFEGIWPVVTILTPSYSQATVHIPS
jgi:hypothetical protein